MEGKDEAGGIPMLVSDVDRDVLRGCEVGSRFKLWTKPDLDYVNVYAPGSLGGSGLAFRLVKADNPKIARQLAEHLPVWIVLSSIDAGRYKVEAFTKSREQVESERRESFAALVAECSSPYSPKKLIKGVKLGCLALPGAAPGDVYECPNRPVEAFCANLPRAVEFSSLGRPPLYLASSHATAVKVVRAISSGYQVLATVERAESSPVVNRDWATQEFFDEYRVLATIGFRKP